MGDIITECYEEVFNGNEVRGVVDAGRRHNRGLKMGIIDETEMWKIGASVRQNRVEEDIPIHPFTAGVYVAMMMAQVDLLLERGHCMSEVANESVIEATDSLSPYMHYKGVSFLVDNCSTTARLGSRKWAPRFDYLLSQQAIPRIAKKESAKPLASPVYQAFLDHKMHSILAKCCEL